MTDLLRLIVDIAQLLFPFRLVPVGRRGVAFFGGYSPRTTLNPGIYPVVPWFTEVVAVPVVPHVYATPTQTIGDISFSASVVVRVTDAWLAYNTLELWHESAVELAGAVLSEAVRESGEAVRLEEVEARINQELAPHGLHVDRVRFLNFTRAPTLRLLASSEKSHE